MQPVQLQVSDEIKALGDSLAGLYGDIKAGKPVTTDVSDAIPGLLAALGGLANLGADIKLPANQVYILYAILNVIEPAPVAAVAVAGK